MITEQELRKEQAQELQEVLSKVKRARSRLLVPMQRPERSKRRSGGRKAFKQARKKNR
jgi:hypothetical protein